MSTKLTHKQLDYYNYMKIIENKNIPSKAVSTVRSSKGLGFNITNSRLDFICHSLLNDLTKLYDICIALLPRHSDLVWHPLELSSLCSTLVNFLKVCELIQQD